jgi:glycosyltransferase involved in cell wall biosynthesis
MESLRFVFTTSFYPPYHLGGDAVHVFYLANALAAKGHEVHVLHSYDAYRLKRREKSSIVTPNDDVIVHTLKHPLGRIGPVKTYISGRSKYFEIEYHNLINEVKPDVVHHHNISLLGHTLFQKIKPYHQLYTAHDYWLICQRNNLMSNGDICQTRNCFSCAFRSKRPPQFWRNKIDTSSIDCIISPSQFLATHFKEIKNDVKVMHNFVPDPPREIMDSGYKDFYLFLGILEPHKGVQSLVQAFSKSKNKLLIGGTGSLKDWIVQTIQNDDLAPRINYLKWVDEKYPLLKDTSAVIIPSLCPENCPMVALEALSVGTPVICSDLGGTNEIIEKISPDLVLPYDEMFKRLQNLEPPKIPREAIKQVFKENFSEKSYIEKYMDIIKVGCSST